MASTRGNDGGQKLASLFRNIVLGNRLVQNTNSAKLFLQAICQQSSPTTCIEMILSKKNGLDALRISLRLNISPDFIHSYSVPLLRYLSDPLVATLANGALLGQLILAMVDPPTFWGALCNAINAPGAPKTSLEPFAWLIYEILSLPFEETTREVMNGLLSDIHMVVKSNILLRDFVSIETRQLAYKIQKALQLRLAPATTDESMMGISYFTGPGGRHDNDHVDFRMISIYPTSDELLSKERPFYRLAAEAFTAEPEHRTAMHLDNQFRLLRESMLSDLREGVQIATGIKKRRRMPVMLGGLTLLGFCTGLGSDGITTDAVTARMNGLQFRSQKASLILSCRYGLERLQAMGSRKRRLDFLKDYNNYLRNQSFGVLVRGTEIFGFAFVMRNEELLCLTPPRVCLQFTDKSSLKKALIALREPSNVQFVLVDTAVFAVEPILMRLQRMIEIPLERQLMEVPFVPGSGDAEEFTPHPDVQWYLETLENEKSKAEKGRTICLPDVTVKNKPVDLDDSQLDSLVNALGNSLTLIQGPPGTGKSFIGALLIKLLWSLTGYKILVTTYTNHALDQFLDDLRDMGIEDKDMVRLGSKVSASNSRLSLFDQRSSYTRSAQEMHLIYSYENEMGNYGDKIEEEFQDYRNFRVTFDTLMIHLQLSEEHSHFADAFSVPEETSDGFEKVGRNGKSVNADYLFERWVNDKDAGHYRKQMLTEELAGVWNLKPTARKALLHQWTSEMTQEKADELSYYASLHDNTKTLLEGIQNQSKKAILQEKRIIACTTTAAAKQVDLLGATKPNIVLIEEAGEILESQVLAALGPSVKQLVLIGDHKQLRPKIDSYALTVERGDGFDLNRSLFERLIRQGYGHTTLQKQHRMSPEISIFSREDTYPEMVDAIPGTQGRPHPAGLRDRVIFVDHNYPEDEDKAILDRRDPGTVSSRSNDFEAHMVLKCVRYLGQQGYGTRNMVVLTPYLGQVRLLLDMFRREKTVDPILNDLDSAEMTRAGVTNASTRKLSEKPLRISTIDNYQGEESDIVIASLTRCNETGNIGFMAAAERLNVLRTRARNCFIMFGSATTFRKSHKSAVAWGPFLDSLEKKGHIYEGLPVRCEQHSDTTSELKNPDDFDKLCPDGGCLLPCGATLPCGQHICDRRCHLRSDHNLPCHAIVEYECPRGHKLQALCSQKDDASKKPCPKLVDHICSKGHKTRVACCQMHLGAQIPCNATVDHTCDRGHRSEVKCSGPRGPCDGCKREDEDIERQAQRDLRLEAVRRDRQAAYRAELQKLDDEIEHKKRIIQYENEDAAEQKKLAQQRAALDALTKTARQVREQQKNINIAKSNEAASQNEPKYSPPLLPSNAREEWEALKKEGAQNDALDEMMGMIGLEEVKQEFLSLKSRIDQSTRQGVSLSSERFSCSLLGNPGTGKTTVARLLMKFLSTAGVIPGGEYKETTGAALANQGVSGCKKMIEEVLDNGGGVVFIDEAYQLSSGTSPGGRAVLDYLLPEVENLCGKIVFILAGYNREMESFFSHNPGLPSRFPVSMKFEDYTDEELLNILSLKVEKRYKGRMKVEDGLRGLYCRIISRRVGRGRGRPGFGNARAIENTLSLVYKRQSDRLRRERRKAGNKNSDDFLLTKEDIIGPEPAHALSNSIAWKKLQKLTGLKDVKEGVAALVDSIQQNYHRELAEQAPIEYSLNKLFLGSPGTGKTTVAKLYGAILVDLGLLSKGEVVVRNPSDFVGSALGQSEKQAKGILAAAQGKVLVIDEAYGLYGGGGSNGGSTVVDPYKTAVVDTIVAEVQSVPGDDRCVLLLGYREEMETMLQNVNPGLSRRFPLASAFNFEDFSDSELNEILNLKLWKQDFFVTDQARSVALEMLGRARNRPNFGNAGEIDILLDKAKARQQRRLTKARNTKSPAVKEDLLEAVDFDENFDRANRSETDVARLFAGTIGQEGVVARLQKFQETVRLLRGLDMDPRENIPFNFLFRGPPGTGKTTTAQKMGKVFYDLGFLDSAVVEQCSATDLVGQYVGQTGPKVQKQLDRALGRVLFIDEAYRLQSSGSTYAKEATDELVDALTKPRYYKKLVVILAGYTEEIDRLMASNPGLTSRFSERIDFRPLTGQECAKLLSMMLRKQKMTLKKKGVELELSLLEPSTANAAFSARVVALFDSLAAQSDWASARDVGTLAKDVFNEALRAPHQGKRIAVTEGQIEDEMRKMLQERQRQSKVQKGGPLNDWIRLAPTQRVKGQDEIVTQPTTQLDTATVTETTTIASNDANSEEPQHPEKAKTVVAESGPLLPYLLCQRDAGVSDEVWEQLQRGREAMEAKEREFRELEQKAKAKNLHDDALREKIITRLLKEEEERKREAAVQKKLAEMGRCSAGYAWIREGSGWRCAGGSHFMSDGEVGKLMGK